MEYTLFGIPIIIVIFLIVRIAKNIDRIREERKAEEELKSMTEEQIKELVKKQGEADKQEKKTLIIGGAIVAIIIISTFLIFAYFTGGLPLIKNIISDIISGE